ncbi:MAG TPA: hypothetical protein VII51_09980 [Gaiellaceae bacterium]
MAVASPVHVASAQGNQFPPQLTRLTKAECPQPLDLPVLDQLDRIRAVLPTLVKRQLGQKPNPNGTNYRNWQVLGAISLDPTYPMVVPGAAHWRAVVAGRCGANVAARSWLLVLQFPEMHAINSVGRFFVALTRRGWEIWASG